jgi:hypothetical protein
MPRKIAGTGLDLNGQKVIGLADGTSPQDAVTKAQLDAIARGLDWKNSVRVATTANITLSGTQTIDSVAVIAGDRVLVKDQSTPANNGIYVVAAGAWSRATDFDDATEVTAAAAIPVEAGTTNGDAVFILTTDGAITVGSTSLAFSRLGGSGATYTAGVNGGLQLSAGAFSILLDSSPGLLLGAGGIKIDPAYSGLAKRYAVNVPATTNPSTITHNLGTLDVIVLVYEITGGAEVDVDVQHATTNTVVLTFGTAPAASQYRCVVLG